MSTYNYLISSCAYPGWAWHNVNYGCTRTNRGVNPCLSLLLYLLLAYFRCSGAWLTLAVTSLFCCSYLAFLTTRLHVDYPRTASVIHILIDIKGLFSLSKQHPSCCLHCGGSILRADTRLIGPYCILPYSVLCGSQLYPISLTKVSSLVSRS